MQEAGNLKLMNGDVKKPFSLSQNSNEDQENLVVLVKVGYNSAFIAKGMVTLKGPLSQYIHSVD